MAKAVPKKEVKTMREEMELRARTKAKLEAKRASLGIKAVPQVSRAEYEAIKKRDEIISQYMPYAASIASRVCQSLSSAVDYEDVLCNARLGLLEAAKKFDSAQEVDFRTFAYYRIKGAIYDGLRRSGWLPRTLYAKIKFDEAANEYLQNRSLHSGESKPVKSATEAPSDDAVVETVNSLASIYIISLDASEDIDVEDTDSQDIETRTEFLQVRRHMRDAISSLPEKEKQLIMMYYFQNRTLEEIGERIGLSKSWASRMHARALEMLFKRIRNMTSDVRGGEVGGDKE